MADFADTVTTSGAGWHNVLMLMQANGWDSGAALNYLTVEEEVGLAVRFKSGVSAPGPVSSTDGEPISALAKRYEPCDAGLAWIYTPGADSVNLAAHSAIDY